MANSKGKIVLPPRVHPAGTRAERDAEYRRFLGLADGEKIPTKLGSGAVSGSDGPAKTRGRRRRTAPTKKKRTTCLRCNKPGRELRFGYCSTCWS